MVSICSFQITNEVKPASMFMDPIHCLFYDIPVLLIIFGEGLVCFYLSNLWVCLYILGANILSVLFVARIFPLFLTCLLSPFLPLFDVF